MKNTLAIFLILFIDQYSHAQNRANIWELSYSDTIAIPNSQINFNSGKADTSSVYRPMAFWNTDASICDSNGNLLFYTNGLYIGNKKFDTLLNSVNFNPGWATTFYEPYGLAACQGAFIIPFPGHSNQYYIFYITGEEFFGNNQTQLQPFHLSYSLIDMALDNGLGGIDTNKKNLYAIQDTLTWGRLTGVKHANGRDWWVIIHRYYSNKYYKLLVTPDSIYGPYSQNIGSVVTTDIGGQATFSPDGSKFAMISPNYTLDYMNFDRCSGDFFNSQIINVPYADSNQTIGCSFSPNSRFLYVSSLYTLWQYDTWATDIASSAIKIAVYDSFVVQKVPVLFFMHQLAPDGKIYLGTWNGMEYLHVINSPDSLGIACDFTQHSFIIPYYNFTVPSFPNYDLGALIGSPCDTLNGIKQVAANTTQLSIYPNPAFNQLNITYNISQQSTLELFDVLGREIMRLTLYPYFKSRIIDVTDLTAGIYELRLITGNEETVKKFVKE